MQRESIHEELLEWKDQRREANKIRGKLYALGRVEDALREWILSKPSYVVYTCRRLIDLVVVTGERILAVDRTLVLDALFASIDADGDGDLTRIEVRHAPFGDTLIEYWIDLDKDHGESVDPEEWAAFFQRFGKYTSMQCNAMQCTT